MTNPILSPDDIAAESALLERRDLTALHSRLERAIRRRQIMLALLPLALALAVGGGALAHFATRAPPAAPVPPTPPFLVHAPAAPVPCVPGPLPLAPPAPAAPPEPARPQRVVSEAPARAPTEAPANVVDAPAEERRPIEASRLRIQLRLFDDAEQALVGGEPEHALERARHLREHYPRGPLDIDAAVIVVRALRALERPAEARAALLDVERHPQAAEKRALLDELREPPPPPPSAPPSRLIAPMPVPLVEREARSLDEASP